LGILPKGFFAGARQRDLSDRAAAARGKVWSAEMQLQAS
jgi:hypothetical protein